MFTALQLLGLALFVAGCVVVAGVGGALIGSGIAATYIGYAGEA
jgi:hypothetical protein